MKYNLSELREIIRNRRSIKPEDFKPRKVMDDMVTEILNNALWAPTHGMTEPWHFVVFQNKAIEELGDFFADTYKNNTPEDLFIQKKHDKFKDRPNLSSVVIAICMKRQKSERIPEMEELAAVACAVQNMHLTATAYGLGGYWSSGPMIYSDETKKYLNLDDKDKCLGLFYLGYTDKSWPVSHRQPLEYHSEWRTK